MESTVIEIVKYLLSQTQSLYKTKAQEKALASELHRILHNVENEPFYNEIDKLVTSGVLGNNLIAYCTEVPMDGPGLVKRCNAITDACNVDVAYRSQVYTVVNAFTVSFFRIINQPSDSDLQSIVNYINQNSANLNDGIQHVAKLIEDFIRKFPPGIPPAKLATPKVVNPPYPKNEHFSNREGLMEEISKGFSGGDTRQYLSGRGGVGKTQIALEYAYRHEGDYEHILWVNAETDASVAESYRDIADAMQCLQIKDPTDEQVRQSVFTWMDSCNTWLCIFDNVIDIPNPCAWWPKTLHGHILMTTQKDYITIGKRIPVAVFLPEEAVAFLKNRTKRDEPEAMNTVARRLGCLPLALEQAAAYLSVNPKIDFEAYAGYLAESGLDVLAEMEGVIDYEKPVTVTMEIAMRRIGLASARQLLNLCAYLAPENIDPSLFSENRELLPEPLQSELAKKLSANKVWRDLCRYSLLEPQKEDKGYSVHRLLQEVVRKQIGNDRQWAKYCLQIFRKSFGFQYGNIESHNTFKHLFPHVETFLEETTSFISEDTEQTEIASLYDKGGLGQFYLGNYRHALAWNQHALAIREKVLGVGHPDTATSYNNIATVYVHQGEYATALAWYQKSLAIREKVLGADHPSTAVSYNNIAAVYDNQGEYATALAWYQKSLAIREKVLGADHPDTASSYNSIALVYAHQGDSDKALPLLTKAHTVFEKKLGKNHPFTKIAAQNIQTFQK